MPMFELQTPDGETYEVEAPDENSALEAIGQAQAPESHSWSELPGNIIPSAVDTAKGVYDMVRHPVDTIENLAKVGSGAINNTVPQLAVADKWLADAGFKTASDPNAVAQQQQMASDTGAALKDRYWGLDNLKNTMITDPVGFGLDAATVYAGGAGLVGRGPLAAKAGLRPAGQTWASEKMLRQAAPKSSQELMALGPDAMLLDASPSMTGLAQGVATVPGKGKNAIVEALVERQAQRTARLEADRVGALGKARDPEILKTVIDKATQRASGPVYKSAKTNAPNVTNELDATITREVSNAQGMSDTNRKIVYKLMDSIDDARNAATPKLTAERLHNLRQELDAKIVYDSHAFQSLSSADKAAQAALKRIRKSLDDVLKNNLPGFKQADDITSKGKKAQDDVDYGFGALEGGKTAHTPERFNLELNRRNPSFVREGMKADIRTAVGTQSNDLPALRKKVGGENDFNRDKIARVFGKPAVDRLTKAIQREELFGQNFADVWRNSQTAPRLEAAKMIEKSDAPTFTGGETATGLTLKSAAKATNYLLSKIASKVSQPTRTALEKALMEKGPNAVRLLDSLISSSPSGGAGKAIIQAIIAGHATETINRASR